MRQKWASHLEQESPSTPWLEHHRQTASPSTTSSSSAFEWQGLQITMQGHENIFIWNTNFQNDAHWALPKWKLKDSKWTQPVDHLQTGVASCGWSSTVPSTLACSLQGLVIQLQKNHKDKEGTCWPEEVAPDKLCTGEDQLFSLNYPRCACSWRRRMCRAAIIYIRLNRGLHDSFPSFPL